MRTSIKAAVFFIQQIWGVPWYLLRFINNWQLFFSGWGVVCWLWVWSSKVGKHKGHLIFKSIFYWDICTTQAFLEYFTFLIKFKTSFLFCFQQCFNKAYNAATCYALRHYTKGINFNIKYDSFNDRRYITMDRYIYGNSLKEKKKVLCNVHAVATIHIVIYSVKR